MLLPKDILIQAFHCKLRKGFEAKLSLTTGYGRKNMSRIFSHKEPGYFLMTLKKYWLISSASPVGPVAESARM
jgi:hypothetical protein